VARLIEIATEKHSGDLLSVQKAFCKVLRVSEKRISPHPRKAREEGGIATLQFFFNSTRSCPQSKKKHRANPTQLQLGLYSFLNKIFNNT
jgi:hypothetical protein